MIDILLIIGTVLTLTYSGIWFRKTFKASLELRQELEQEQIREIVRDEIGTNHNG